MALHRPLSSAVVSTLVFAFVGLTIACGSEAEPRRVLDVKSACVERQSWNPNADMVCAECQSYAKVPACACPASRDFGGACEVEATRQNQNPDCTADVLTCAAKCGNDCACADACFANHASCSTDYAAVATCVLDTCTRYCQ